MVFLPLLLVLWRQATKPATRTTRTTMTTMMAARVEVGRPAEPPRADCWLDSALLAEEVDRGVGEAVGLNVGLPLSAALLRRTSGCVCTLVKPAIWCRADVTMLMPPEVELRSCVSTAVLLVGLPTMVVVTSTLFPLCSARSRRNCCEVDVTCITPSEAGMRPRTTLA